MRQVIKLIVPAILLASLVTGCADISPGKVDQISSASVQPRVGNVYCFRGFIGIFSTGMNQLDTELNDQGIHAMVFQADQWSDVADTIAAKYKSQPNAEPLVLVGHSYGADNVLRIAQKLKDKDVKIDLIITLDPVTPPKVAPEVAKVVNLYQSNGIWDNLPWLRGIPLEAEKPNTVALLNENIRTDRKDLLDDDLSHFNIEKKAKVHAEVIKVIKQVCIDRGAWLAMHDPHRGPTLAAIHPAAPTTQSAQARVE
ncbi:MAG: thioesterase domain-containing protein [Tepidisphaeraceae bacterium]